MPFKEIRNVVYKTYRPPEKPMPVIVQNPPTPPSQIKDPSLTDGSWRRELPPSINQEYPLVNSIHIKKMLDII